MKRSFLILIILLILLTNTFAQDNYGIWLHNIDIEVNTTGEVEVSEKFYLFFENDVAQLEFRENRTKFGSDLTLWEEFNSRFKSTIGGTKAVNKKINYSEGADTFLQITYNLIDPLMAQGKETALVSEYSIKANYLNNLYESGLWVIPENTRVSIILPAGAEIKDIVKPQATIINYSSNRKQIIWEGYKSSNELSLKYFIWKKIDPIFDLNKVSNFMFRTQEGLILLVILLIIISGIIWKRKLIADKIEDFVEANTILKEE